MSQFLFVEKDSLFHRLHPSGKIIGVILSFIFPLAFNDPRYILGLWLIALPAGIASGAFQVLRKLVFIFSFILLASFILWLFFTKGGPPEFTIAGLSISKVSILYASAMALRLGLLLFFGMVFIASTRIEELFYGLNWLRIPFPVSFAISLSFRLVPIFSESAQTIIQAQRSRGLKISGGIISKFQSYFPLFVPVFLSALRRVNHLSIALESKGFGANVKRTSWLEFKWRPRDFLFLSCLLMLTIVCIFLRLNGLGTLSP